MIIKKNYMEYMYNGKLKEKVRNNFVRKQQRVKNGHILKNPSAISK